MKAVFLIYRRSTNGFYPVCNSSGVIVAYLDLPSRQNNQRAGYVRHFLVWHLPFPIGYPIHCSYSLVPFSFFRLWSRSSFQSERRLSDRRSWCVAILSDSGHSVFMRTLCNLGSLLSLGRTVLRFYRKFCQLFVLN